MLATRDDKNTRAEFGKGVKRAFIASALTIMTISVGQARQAITVDKIETDLSAKRPEQVVRQYFDCGPNIGAGYRLVESGTPSGVRLGVTMLKYSDACSGESLDSSLGVAMTRAPLVVLPYVNSGPGLSAEEICLPFLTADEPREKLRSIVARAHRSLLNVHTKALEKQKVACLQEIMKATLAIR